MGGFWGISNPAHGDKIRTQDTEFCHPAFELLPAVKIFMLCVYLRYM